MIKTCTMLCLITTSSWAQQSVPASPPSTVPIQKAPEASVSPSEASADTDGSSVPPSAVTPQLPEETRPTQPVGPPPPPPKAELTCDQRVALVAQPVTCTIRVTHPSSMTVRVDQLPGAESGAATLPQEMGKDQLVTERLFIFRHREVNKPLRIKDVRIHWDAIGGHKGVVELPDQKIPTKSTLSGVSNPLARDFAHPLGQSGERDDQSEEAQQARANYWRRHAPPSLLEPNWTLIILLAALMITLIGAVIGWIVRRWNEARAANRGPYVDPRPAHEIAFAHLLELERARLIENGEFKNYSLRISEIIRAYFGKRFEFAGLEMTSDELREALSSVDLSDEATLVLNDFLSDTDLIKFADLSTSAQALEELGRRARRLIDLTREPDVTTDSIDSTELLSSSSISREGETL